MDLLTETQKEELLSSLLDRAETPLKFAYLGDGAVNWERLVKHYVLRYTQSEHRLLRSAVNYVRTYDPSDEIYLVDLGCGTGDPAELIVRYLRTLNVDVHYVPVDISEELLRKASKRLSKEASSVHPIRLDFDNGSLVDALRPFRDLPRYLLIPWKHVRKSFQRAENPRQHKRGHG